MKRGRQRGRGRRGVRAPASAPSTDQLLNEWVSWLIDVEGIPPAKAEEYRSVIIDFQRRTGLSDLTSAKRVAVECYLDETEQEDLERERRLEDLKRYLERTDLAEIDREDLEWLRGELERLGEADPGPEH